MDTWFQIKGEGIGENNILVLQNDSFYSKGNTIIRNITVQSDVVDITCNILEGENINDASIVDKKHISFVAKDSIISFFNRILFKFITPVVQIDIIIVKRKDGSINTTFTKGSVSSSFLIKNDQTDRKQEQSTLDVFNIKQPNELFFENINLFGDLLEPLYSNFDEQSLYVQKWKSIISSIPNSDKLKEEFANFENDINLWFNVLFSWGIKRDKCKEYKKGTFNRDFYDVESVENNSNALYKVLTPYWSFIKRKEGVNQEIIIKKGQLKG